MTSVVWVKVIGFSDTERHSLNTLFRLSGRNGPTYALWTPEAPVQPHVALVDVDSYEAGLELASPSLSPSIKMICVGTSAPLNAWRVVQRPVDWTEMVQTLDTLFDPNDDLDFDLDEVPVPSKVAPAGIKASLIVGLTLEERMYLRARLALAGLTDVDETPTALQASAMVVQRSYALVIVCLELGTEDPWRFVESLNDFSQRQRSVVVATHNPSWNMTEQAEGFGCLGLMEIPFDPQQVFGLFQKV
jgi:hypothetical protein